MMDVLVIGAGPAGMSAALELRSYGLSVTVVDDQPLPGGRIFAAIENRKTHGAEDERGAALVSRFRASGGEYLAATEVWQIERGPRVFLTRDGNASMIEPRYVLLATGAQERPLPFPGWQLPGVMTVGAAQILLKTARQIPDHPVWLAGSGPLLLLYAMQLLEAGGTVAGILDMSPRPSLSKSAKLALKALSFGWRDLARGIGWLARLRLRGVNVVRDVVAIEANGNGVLSEVRYTTGSGGDGKIATALLLVHDGVVPSIHGTLSAGCEHRWNTAQRCFEPVLDDFGASSESGIFVAGDGATIAGGRVAAVSGRLAAIGIATAAGALTTRHADALAAPLRRTLESAAHFRQLVDTLYPPIRPALDDNTIVCRCEEVTAGQIRQALKGRPELGPDGAKIATRAGMGPCQGRQCGLTLTRMAAEASGRSEPNVGFLRIRPPLKPLTIGELASLETPR